MIILSDAEQKAVLSGRTPLNLAVARHIQDAEARAYGALADRQHRERQAMARALDTRLSEVLARPAAKRRPRTWVNPMPQPNYEVDWSAIK